MIEPVKQAYQARNNRREHAVAAIKGTKLRLKPANLKNEAQQALKTKALNVADNVSQAAKRNRFKILTASGIAAGAMMGAFLYKPIKKQLSEDRKV
jgi:hypothetical protein